MAIDRYLRIKQVSEITGLSRATIYNMEKAGDFPQKTVLSTRAVAWRESAVVEWMDSRKNVTKSGREAAPGDAKKSVERKREIKKEKGKKGGAITQNNPLSDVTRNENPIEIAAPQIPPVRSCEGGRCESDEDWPRMSNKVVSSEKRPTPQKRKPITAEELRSAVVTHIEIRKRSQER